LALISTAWANRRAVRDRFTAGQLVTDDLVAQVDALVANEDRRTGNQLLDFVLALAAERAVQGFFAGGAFFLGHGGNAL
jgi:hypothetical protein